MIKSARGRPPITRERCPACAREFTLGLTTARNGIRCPHCRTPVTVRGSENEEASCVETPGAKKTAADIDQCLKTCEALRTRIEKLEELFKEQVKASGKAPAAEPAVVAASSTASRSVASAQQLELNPRSAVQPNAVANRAPQTAAAKEIKGELHIIAAVHDAATRDRIGLVEKICAEAGWSTREQTTHHVPCTVPLGFTLSVSSEMSRERLKSIFDTFCNARLPVKLQLDPRPREEEAILFIGAAVAEE